MVFQPFEEARNFIRSLGLQNKNEWKKWARSNKRPKDIPLSPSDVYKTQGWKSWGDWLGTDYVASQNRIYKPFDEARKFIRRLGIKSQTEYKKWAKNSSRPDDIPRRPDAVYKTTGWISWGDWLGTGYIANQERVYRSYEDARAFVHALGFNDQITWRRWTKTENLPSDIPANPARVYKNLGWVSWGDWLGTGRIANQNRVYLSFEEGRTIVRSLKLKNQKSWHVWAKSSARLENIPADPSDHYHNKGWISWGDWLGTA